MHTKPVFVLLLLLATASGVSAQPAPAEPRTPTQVIVSMVASSEKELVDVANEMPEDKYGFVPTGGSFRGVRSFAQQIKHAAAVHNLVAANILGEPITADVSDERGPDSVKTKAEVVKYLQDSYAYLKKAAATIDEKNAFTPVKGVFGSAPTTRISLIVLAVSHSSNHYGQVVEYLRMNGLVPPGSR
jgi:uncharacterized damage-inducible protein DinB